MMDYYSEFPAPPMDTIIEEISPQLKCKWHYNIKPSVLKKVINTVVQDMGGHSCLGSFSGYYVFSRHEILKRSIDILKFQKTLKCLSFKSLVIVILSMINLKNTVIHKRYQPGGEEYQKIKSRLRFYQNIPPWDEMFSFSHSVWRSALPPINSVTTRPIPKPIKDAP
jgi:hypothetical protein